MKKSPTAALVLGTLLVGVVLSWTTRSVSAFRPATTTRSLVVVSSCSRRQQLALLKAENSFNEVSDDDDEMTELLQSFKNRQDEIRKDERQREINLRKAACQSDVSIVLPDWVRRLDVDYPLVACGSASNDIYIAHLETGQVLASTSTANNNNDKKKNADDKQDERRLSTIAHDRVEHTIHQLYGQFDGGGTLAVALKGTLMVEARRSGGVHVWRLNPDNDSGSGTGGLKLVSQGFMPALQDCLVTALHISDDGYLWATTDEGSVEAYCLDDSSSSQQLPLTLRLQPDLLWKLGEGSSCTVLSLDVNTEVGCAVVATDTGSVFLLSLEDDDDDEQQKLVRKPIGSFVPPFDGTERRSSNVFPTCATIVTSSSSSSSLSSTTTTTTNEYGQNIQVNYCPNKRYYIACGANDGSLYLQSLKTNDVGGDIDTERPFVGQHIRQLMPKHFATVKAMASPAPGLLITGGLDGTLRLWDIGGGDLTDNNDAKFLYQFVGYKVWLGSLWRDWIPIVTDGTDNTVIVHRFETPASKKMSPDEQPPEDTKEGNDM